MLLSLLSRPWLKSILDEVDELIFPAQCWICDEHYPKDELAESFCPKCRKDFFTDPLECCPFCASTIGPHTDLSEGCPSCRKVTNHFSEAIRIGTYDGIVRNAVLKMKYPPGEFMAEAVGRVWGRSAAFQKKSWDLIVPIPLHWKKRIRRGYNQSYALARGLSTVLKIPVEHRWLTRFINNPSQATLMRHERIKNAVGIFKASGRRELGRVLLIDDVVTTGSTVNEAARVLKQSGAAQVTVATVAHG